MESIVAPPPRSSPKSFCTVGAGSGRVVDTVATRATGNGTVCAFVGSGLEEAGVTASGISVAAIVEFVPGGLDGAGVVVASTLGGGEVALAASAAAVAVACFLMAPVMSSILL